MDASPITPTSQPILDRAVVIPFSAVKAAKDAARRANAVVGLVYLVRGDHPDAVKIGFTTDLTSRLRGLQTGMAGELYLAACFPGTMYDERDLHVRFAQYLMRGEWFRLAKPVAAKIASLRRRKNVMDLIDRYQPQQREQAGRNG